MPPISSNIRFSNVTAGRYMQDRTSKLFQMGYPRFLRRPQIGGYAFAIISVIVAFVVRLLIDPWVGDQSPYIMFVVAVAVTGLFADVRAAFLATGLGAILAYVCFVPPRYRWGFAGLHDAVSFGVYLLASVAAVLLTRARNNAVERARQSLETQLQAERELVDTETKFRKFMDNSAARVFLRDDYGRFVYANEAAKIGLAGKNGAQIPAHLLEQDQQVLRAEQPIQFTDKIVGPSGERVWLTNKFPFVDHSGRRFVGGFSVDITDRLRAEDIVMKTHRFAAAGQMASLLAHEVNNPLAALTNVFYLLATHPLDAAAQDLVKQGSGALARINHITAMTLSFYAENDSATLLPIRELIDEVADVLSSIDPFKHIKLVRELNELNDTTITASAGRIRQLVQSLLTNAMESGARTVHIRARKAQNFSRPRRSGVRITISDDGRGISRGRIADLFEPFVTTKTDRGTGLGLWTCNAIVLRAGGTIRIRSNTEGARTGTCVFLFLPQRP
jgi:PAS domain S-box-containing protein